MKFTEHPKVVSVYLNKGRKLHTTRSWDFLGLEHNGVTPPNSAWEKARYGEDTIIANLDTGKFFFLVVYLLNFNIYFSLNFKSSVCT